MEPLPARGDPLVGLHGAVSAEVVPGAVDLSPSGLPLALLIVVPATAILVPAIEHGGGGRRRGINGRIGCWFDAGLGRD